MKKYLSFCIILLLPILLFSRCGKSGLPYDFIYAARDGDFKFVKECVNNKKVDVNAQLEGGCTALYMASIKNRPDMFKFLLDHGADPTIKCDPSMFHNMEKRNFIDEAEGTEVIKLLNQELKKYKQVEKEVNLSEWKSASGNMWSNVKLYYGPKKMYVGQIICFDKNHNLYGEIIDGVKIKSYSGSHEWKTR